MGENKVQELRDKDAVLAGTGAERHFIGHLQTNKVKDVLKYVSCVQSVDRMPVGRRSVNNCCWLLSVPFQR